MDVQPAEDGENMSNANRKAGDRAEYEAIRMLEDDGYYTTRSAGSLGEFDIAAFSSERSLLVQVKSSSSETRLRAAMRKARDAVEKYDLAADIEVWGRIKGSGRRPARWIKWGKVEEGWSEL